MADRNIAAPLCEPVSAFVGRRHELERLRAWASELDHGVGRFVLVTGEAGIGKSRLCAQFTHRTGLVSATAKCWPGSGGPPLWPWPQLIAQLAGEVGEAAPCGPVTTPGDRFEAFQAITDRLRRLARAGPIVVVIDDLDVADPDARVLTRFVVRSLSTLPVLLVATWRTVGDGTDPALEEVGRDASVVALHPFTAEEVSAFVARTDPAPSEVTELLQCTGGNPMYLTEVRSLPRRQRHGGLARVVARKVADLDDDTRTVLRAAAVLGDGASVGETAQLADRSVDTVLAAVQQPPAWATVRGTEITFTHDLLQAALVSSIKPLDRARLHARAAEIVAGREPEQLVRRARHAVEAVALTGPDPAVRACVSAATALRGALAFDQAAQWARRGCELVGGGIEPRLEAAARIALADALLAGGRLADAREEYQLALAPAQAAHDPRLFAVAAIGVGGIWVEEERDELSRRALLQVCERARVEVAAHDGLLAARLGVRIAAERCYKGDPVDDVACAAQAVHAFGDDAASAEALSLHHHTLMVPERIDERLVVVDAMLDASCRAPGSIYSLFGLMWRTVDLYQRGDPAAERAFSELQTRAARLGTRSIGYIVAVIDVMRTIRRGELEHAVALADAAVALGNEAGDNDVLAYWGGHLLAVRWVQGRLDELVEPIEEVASSATLRRRDRIYDALLVFALALRGDEDAARSALRELGPVDAIPSFSTRTGTMAVLAEAAALLGDADLADQVACAMTPVAHLPVMPSLAVICLGPGERVVGQALATAGDSEGAVTWLRRAMTANRRLGNRPFDAMIRADLAAALVARGRPEDADEARRLVVQAIAAGNAMGLHPRTSWWQDRLDALGADAAAPEPARRGLMARRGASWRLGVEGRCVEIDDGVGVRYLAELLKRPDTDIAATELSASVGGGAVVAQTTDTVLDARAVQAYRLRLAALERELDMADLTGDQERGRRASEERQAVLDALRQATGRGGRTRAFSDDAERCRMRVTKAIRRSLARISAADATLGRSLGASVRTGFVCRYETDPMLPIAWSVES
jgi:tetratricopeptide (TPR) repeat protein